MAIKVNFDGTILNSSGRTIANINKSSRDSAYDITVPTHPLRANAIVITSANAYISVYRTLTATGIRLYTRTTTNTPGSNTAYDFNLLILAL
jgi:hypothetical protein